MGRSTKCRSIGDGLCRSEAMGGRDPKRAWLSVRLARPYRRSGQRFSGRGGQEKEKSPVLRTGRIGGRGDGGIQRKE